MPRNLSIRKGMKSDRKGTRRANTGDVIFIIVSPCKKGAERLNGLLEKNGISA